MNKKRILVLGSSNTDMVIEASRLPQPGETILGGDFFMNPGGKGANQAVAVARLGGEVSFIGKIGEDSFGKNALQSLKGEGINIDHVIMDHDSPSGVALIIVDSEGENSIIVAPGSNETMNPQDVHSILNNLLEFEIFLAQLEIPLEIVELFAKKGYENKKTVIINPAPAVELSDDLFRFTSIITPNETEAEFFTGIRIVDELSARKASEYFHAKGVGTVIITLGSRGAFLSYGKNVKLIPAPGVSAVDTTAAGDTFNGALAVAISEGKNLEEAVQFANHAGSIAVTRKGAQSSIPYRREIKMNIPYNLNQ